MRGVYLAAGAASLLLGILGAVLPLLPTVPFVILAAYCFGRSDPRLERRLLEHPRFGAAIRQWRERRAVSRRGKIAATLAFGVSSAVALAVAPFPVALVPMAAALVVGVWLWSRPEA